MTRQHEEQSRRRRPMAAMPCRAPVPAAIRPVAPLRAGWLLAGSLLAGSLLAAWSAHAGDAAAATVTAQASEHASLPARTVVELFTSQACAACPPADSVIGRYADDREMVVLTFPVDYWNYLGWADTFATKVGAQRQFAYADRRRDRQVYTPQVIIDGSLVSGGNEREIDRDIVRAATRPLLLPVGVSLQLEEGVLRIRVAATPGRQYNATIWLASLDPDESVTVGGGENSGRTLHYRNIVRDLRAVGIWNGSEVQIDLPAAALITGLSMPAAVPGSPPAPGTPPSALARHRWRSAVVVQADADSKPGAILGASWVEYDVSAN